MKRVFGNLLIGFTGGALAFGVGQFFFNEPPTAFIIEKSESEKPPYRLTNSEEMLIPAAPVDFTDAADLSVNSVVHIQTEISGATGYTGDPFHDYFFGPRRNGVQEAAGSGVILSSDGYIVTNNHVISQASKIMVTLNNSKSYKATLVGTDPGTDIAVLKVEAKNLPAIKVGNSDNLKVGEWVLAVGNPFNLTSTVTAGIISAKSRNINILEGNPDQNVFPIESFIQTDAAVNPGNSGGALVNANGELIGINTAIASNTGSFSGYSFAVPINLVQKVTNDLIQFGIVQRGFLGVNIRNIDQELADELGMVDIRGVYVGGLVENGAAETAGIKEGDIILNIGASAVNSSPHLQEIVGRYRPGDVIPVRILRDNQERIVNVTLKNSEGTTSVVKKEEISGKMAIGASFNDLTAGEKSRFKLNGGAKILSLSNGRLRSAGIKAGFIITKIDNKEIKDADQAAKILESKKGQVIIEGIYPNGTKGYYAFGL